MGFIVSQISAVFFKTGGLRRIELLWFSKDQFLKLEAKDL